MEPPRQNHTGKSVLVIFIPLRVTVHHADVSRDPDPLSQSACLTPWESHDLVVLLSTIYRLLCEDIEMNVKLHRVADLKNGGGRC